MRDNRLFCFHHAGGSSLIFNKWKKFSPMVNVIPVEIPGHGIRMGEKCLTDFNQLVSMLTDEVKKLCGDGNIYLYGHSLGSAIAFEVTRRLEKKYGLEVSKLFVAGRHPPFMKDPSEYRTSDGIEALKYDLLRLGMVTDENLSDKVFLETFLPIIYADYCLHEDYRYNGGVVGVPVVAFSGSDDESAPKDIVSEWRKVTKSTFRQYQFYGGHFFPYNESEKEVMSTIIREIKE